MSRGISPIVSVVLLISIAVIAAVGIYFWAGGLATKQQTTNTPIAISAYAIDPANGIIAIANLGEVPLTTSFLYTTCDTTCNFSGEVIIQPGEQEVCTMAPHVGECVIYGTTGGGSSSSGTGSAEIHTSRNEVEEVTFQEEGFSLDWSNIWTGTFTNTIPGSILFDADQWLIDEVCIAAGDQHTPNMAIGPDGVVHIVWEDERDLDSDVYYTNSSTNWEEVAITDSASNQKQPKISIGPDGVVHIVWVGNDDGSNDLYYANSSSDWAPVQVTKHNANQLQPDIVIGLDGVVHIAWYGMHDDDGEIYYANSSSSWAEVNINQAHLNHQYNPSLDIDSNGFVHIAWYSDHEIIYKIFYANSSDSWNNVPITPAATFGQMYPSLAVDSNDNVHLVWDGVEADSSQDIYYTNSSLGWTISKINDTSGWQAHPSLDIDSEGIAHVFWSENDGMTYVNSTGNWDELKLSTGLTAQEYFALAVGPDNIVHTVWEESTSILYSNSDARYYLQGQFTSDYLDTTYSPANFTEISWTNNTPTGTTFEMKLQFANNSGFDPLTNVTLTDSPQTRLNDQNQFARYWVNITTTNRWVTPSLTSIALTYAAVNGNLTYTVNSDDPLTFVYLNSSCYDAAENPIVNESASGTFYTNTITNNTACNYTVWGPEIEPTASMGRVELA